MFQIGDRRMLISYLGLLSDLLGKAAKEGKGVVRSIHRIDSVRRLIEPPQPLLCQGGEFLLRSQSSPTRLQECNWRCESGSLLGAGKQSAKRAALSPKAPGRM